MVNSSDFSLVLFIGQASTERLIDSFVDCLCIQLNCLRTMMVKH